jgi:hypothetical protein
MNEIYKIYDQEVDEKNISRLETGIGFPHPIPIILPLVMFAVVIIILPSLGVYLFGISPILVVALMIAIIIGLFIIVGYLYGLFVINDIVVFIGCGLISFICGLLALLI